MILTASARRLSACAIGIVAAAALTVACSTSTAGTADTTAAGPASATAPSSVSVSLPSVSIPASAPISLPASAPISLPASIPALGGSQFCRDLSSLGNIGNSLAGGAQGNLTKFLAGLDKIVAEAPAEIKPDVQALADYVHGAVTGHVDPAAAQKLVGIEQHLVTYIATNCHP